jgi:hypothetical protein
MHKEIFDNESFKLFSDSNLVLVNADFPRSKKNRLSSKQQDLNNAMADQYNSLGKFPFTVLLDADGKVLKEWDGFSGDKPESYISQIISIIDRDK